jgi:SulP family sulfate permease
MRLAFNRAAHSLRFDLFAGFTVAMVAIPQAMAYAAIAGVGPIYGLYCAIVPAIAGALFGASSHLVTGPTNATALVTANVLVSSAGQVGYLDLVFGLAILAGLIKLALGLLRLGWIIRFVSHSVLTGFLTGAAILIILSQIASLLGLPRAAASDSVSVVTYTVQRLGETNLYVLSTGACTIMLLLALKRADRKLPAELLAIGVIGIAVRVLGWDSAGVRLVSDLGALSEVALTPRLPQLALAQWQALLPSAGALALFSLVEAMSITKAVADKSGATVDASREFVGQGMASLLGGFWQSMPSSGSLARTAINFSSGGRTRMAAVVSGVVVLFVLVAFGDLLSYIPVASLAAVVVVSAYNLINRRQIMQTWQSHAASRFVMGVTFLATLLLPLHVAIYLGALLSLAIYIFESSKLEISYLTQNPAGGFVEHSMADIMRDAPAIAIINIEGTLSFGAADDLEQRIGDIIRSGVRVVILRLRRMHVLSSTGIAALEHIATSANRCGTRVLICGVREDVGASLHSAGIDALIGSERIFKASDVLFASTQQALERAQEIVLDERTHGD